MRAFFAILTAVGCLSGVPTEAAAQAAKRQADVADVPRASTQTMEIIAQGSFELPPAMAKRKRYVVKEKHWEARLAAFQKNELDVLALAITSASDGTALDWYYLAMIAKDRGAFPAARRYLWGAADALSYEIRRVPLHWSDAPENQVGCGVVSAALCPTTSLTTALVALLREVDSALDLEAGVQQSAAPADVRVGTGTAANLAWRYGHEHVFRYLENNDGTITVLVPPEYNLFRDESKTEAVTHVSVFTKGTSWTASATSLRDPAEFFSPTSAISAFATEGKNALAAFDTAITAPTDDIVTYLRDVKAALKHLRDLPKAYAGLVTHAGPDNAELAVLQARASETEKNALAGVRTVVAERAKTWIGLPEILALTSEFANDAEFTGLVGPLIEVRCDGANVAVCGDIAATLTQPSQAVGDSQSAAPYLLFMAPSPPLQSSRVVGEKPVEGVYVSSQREVRNPHYYALMAALEQVRMRMAYAQMEGNSNSYAVGVGQQTRIMGEMSATSPTILEDITSPYQFRTATTRARYQQQVRLLFVQRASGRNKSAVATLVEEADFDIPVGMHARDVTPQPEAVPTQATIRDWLTQPRQLTVAAIEGVDWKDGKALTPNGAFGIYEAAVNTSEGFAAANATTAAATASHSATAQPSISNIEVGEDPRAKHVVVISTPSGTGSGFFIGQRNIITNEHVVGADRTVYVRMHGQSESILAKVIAVDPGRDLALLQTEIPGPAASLLGSGQTIEIGARVSVIGHPKGLEFTLTSGIVSAIRPNFMDTGATFIQTDTALNPGNSGGPMFMGNNVIGVISRGRRQDEGLSFAVHVNEIRIFLANAYLQ